MEEMVAVPALALQRLECAEDAAIARADRRDDDSDDEERDHRRHDGVCGFISLLDCDEQEQQQQQHELPRASASKAKHDVAATLLRMDHFADRLASIRSNLAARSASSVPVAASLPLQLPRTSGSPAPAAPTASLQSSSSSSFEQLKLPLVQLLAATHARAAPPSDTFLSLDAVKRRAALQQQFASDAERLAAAEQAAADALQDADRLTEDARIAMVLYTQHERSWSFDERARRYQSVLDAKVLAESARALADDRRADAQALRSQLASPYGSLKSLSSQLSRVPSKHKVRCSPRPLPLASDRSALPASPNSSTMLVWILAAPSTTLSFTPRASTVATVLAAEKELSTHVVYYAAASTGTPDDRVDDTSDSDDAPPLSGWISVSSHGVAPVPQVTRAKSSIETWVVSGAGAHHLNGRYIYSGVHDGVRTFKSSTGVELFRKRIPIASSLANSLYDAPEAMTPDTASDSRGLDDAPSNNTPASQLPSALQAIEQNTTSFRAMSRIGAWLGANEVREKFRRRRERALTHAASSDDPPDESHGRQQRVPDDGDSVMTQNARGRLETSDDVQPSRPGASAPLCREWVLFMRCSRRHTEAPAASVTSPSTSNKSKSSKASGLGCLKRHYYISHNEKAMMATWAQDREAQLEMRVLECIVKREEQLARIQRLCAKCMSKFQQSLVRETERVARKLLLELQSVRFLSVKVLEAIEHWRAHARKLGFARVDDVQNEPQASQPSTSSTTEPPVLGWSASITLSTGRTLFKRSHAFVSQVKRFCRAEDATDQKEQHVVYLGYFATRMEAERAYEAHAAAEARRLNTTTAHLPRHRNVLRSCGKHYAVESERLGPTVCIECNVAQLAARTTSGNGTRASGGASDWSPPFCYTPGENYILKMASDLDFLDAVPPLTSLLNDGHGKDAVVFPILGNVFLLPTTPVQDPTLAVFASCGLARAPALGVALDRERLTQDITDESLDRDRILAAQRTFLQELQIYQPELFEASSSEATASLSRRRRCRDNDGGDRSTGHDRDDDNDDYRLIQALYWDRCAALAIQQRRAPLAFRQDNTWCRPDAGEWASLAVRGKHQQHFLFELKLALAGKAMQEKRKVILHALRRLVQTPLYAIHTRERFTTLLTDAKAIKGDVVLLEVKSATKYLAKYDAWCAMTRVIQRWYRGVRGRHRAATRRAALRAVCAFRRSFAKQVVAVATAFYERDVVPQALRRAARAIAKPEFTAALQLDGEYVVVSVHAIPQHRSSAPALLHKRRVSRHALERSMCCAACARRFYVRSEYNLRTGHFEVAHGAVCSCSFGSSDREAGADDRGESWLVRAYNPASNVTYRMKIESSLVQQLLSALEAPSLDHSATGAPVNPVKRKRATHARAVVAANQANYCRAQCKHAHQELMNWRLLSTEATQQRKTAVIARDRTLSALARLQKSYELSVGSAKAALDFTSRRFDEAQAWDPLENANDWQQLVHKRQLARELVATEQTLDRCRLELFRATYDEQFAKARTLDVQQRYEHAWLPHLREVNEQLALAATHETASQIAVTRAMAQLCHQFLTLRDTYSAPTRRHLVLASALWRDRSGMRVAIPGLLRTRNIVRRRALLLSNDSKRGHVQTARMVVDVSVARASQPSGSGSHDVWVSAYDPRTSRVQEVFLEWELVELLVGRPKKTVAPRTTARKTNDAPSHRRFALQATADALLRMAMLDRFTGAFTLRKLQFFHYLRLLRPQFLASKWFRDVSRGRKCGDGDEVLRQAASVDGRLVVAVVYENWGDLTLALYHAASGEAHRVCVPLHDVLAVLSTKPLMLRLYVSCVKANSYTPALLTYLLKHVRFRAAADSSSDGEALRLTTATTAVFEPHVPSASTTKRVQKAMTIQRRRVLVSIREDAAGDLVVKAFDWTQQHTYTLLLEREHVRRLLRQTDTNTTLSTRSERAARQSRLLLQQHRHELFEWIVSRLTFQSLLEHPRVLAAAHSPLVSSAHVRQSVAMLNTWIASSVRNPVAPVTEATVRNWMAAVDTDAVAQLQFDQLALVAESTVPLEFDTQRVGTLDWVAKSPASSASPFLKMDVFVHRHDLFLRLRHELQHETAARLERATQDALTNEERQSLVVETQRALKSTTAQFGAWQTQALRVKEWFDGRDVEMRQLHRELVKRVAALSKAKGALAGATSDQIQTTPSALVIERVADHVLHGEARGEGNPDDSSSNEGERAYALEQRLPMLFAYTEQGGDAALASVVVERSAGSLAVASRVLTKCWDYIEQTLKPAVADLETASASLAAKTVALESARALWRAVMRFQSSAVVQTSREELASSASEATGKGVRGIQTVWNDQVAVDSGTSSQGETLSASSNILEPSSEADLALETAILIPSSCSEPLQELFLGSQADALTLAMFLKPLLHHSASKSRASSSDVICTQAVHHGLLAFQVAHCDATAADASERHRATVHDWNPRACVIARTGARIVGPALYYAPHSCDARVFLDRLERITHLYCERALAEAALADTTDASHSGAMRRKQLGNRVKQQLPWKVNASERLQVARSLKRVRAAEHVALSRLDVTVESASVARLTVSFRQLELFLGSDALRLARLHALLPTHLSSLVAATLSAGDGSGRKSWTLDVSKPLRMRNTLSLDGSAPSALVQTTSDAGLRLEHLQVQVDRLDAPRRLLFSCRELQSQRWYYFECSLHDVQQRLLRTLSRNTLTQQQQWQQQLLRVLQARREALSIDDWRYVAQTAATMLVFRKRNGAMGLAFASDATAVDGDKHQVAMTTTRTSLDTVGSRQSQYQYQETADLATARLEYVRRRLAKHQSMIRLAACRGLIASQRVESTNCRRSVEWVRMASEDSASHACRGLLVLETKVLKKLENALASAAKHVAKRLKTAVAPHNDASARDARLQLQLHEIASAMGLKDDASDGANVVVRDFETTIRVIRLTAERQRRTYKYNKTATSRASRSAHSAPVNLCEAAEWWRQHSVKAKYETSQSKR